MTKSKRELEAEQWLEAQVEQAKELEAKFELPPGVPESERHEAWQASPDGERWRRNYVARLKRRIRAKS
jgi:hypothetical protein